MEIDRALGERRGRGLHARMLANIWVKRGDIDRALALLEEAWQFTRTDELRNRSRVLTVRGKALIGRDPAEADKALFEAWQLAVQASANTYDLEIADARGDAAAARGDRDTAREQWGGVWRRLVDAGHPREAELRAKLSTLR